MRRGVVCLNLLADETEAMSKTLPYPCGDRSEQLGMVKKVRG
jgi:hypothetical protein